MTLVAISFLNMVIIFMVYLNMKLILKQYDLQLEKNQKLMKLMMKHINQNVSK